MVHQGNWAVPKTLNYSSWLALFVILLNWPATATAQMAGYGQELGITGGPMCGSQCRVRRRMVSRNGTVLGLKRMGQSYLYANVAATLRAPVLVAMVACKCHIRSKPACSRLDIPIVA